MTESKINLPLDTATIFHKARRDVLRDSYKLLPQEYDVIASFFWNVLYNAELHAQGYEVTRRMLGNTWEYL